jgi:hypothetical protein
LGKRQTWPRGAPARAPDRRAVELMPMRAPPAAAYIVGATMTGKHRRRRYGLALVAATALVAFAGLAGSATGYTTQYCSQVPIYDGTPPWGFNTGQPITGATGSYARGHGDINLEANTVSGILCQVDRSRNLPDRLIVMNVEPHLGYHSHFAQMWGYPGNIMHITVRVTSSTDSRCKVGTIGHVTLFASYNNVRSDSVQFFFPAACKGHDHLYHGPQVNNQVPPA